VLDEVAGDRYDPAMADDVRSEDDVVAKIRRSRQAPPGPIRELLHRNAGNCAEGKGRASDG